MKDFKKSQLLVRPDGVRLKIITFRAPEELHDQLREDAKMRHRSVTAQIIHILEQYFDTNATE